MDRMEEKKQRKTIAQVSRAYKTMQLNQDKCPNMSIQILPFKNMV